MEIKYFDDNGRLVIVCDELVQEERAKLLGMLEEMSTHLCPSSNLKAFDVYKGRFLSGTYAGKTVEEALSKDGDTAFREISCYVKTGKVALSAKDAVNRALNAYLYERFSRIDDPAAYAAEKDDTGCDGFMEAFVYAYPYSVREAYTKNALDLETKRKYVARTAQYLRDLMRKVYKRKG